MTETQTITENVKEYYGEVLETKDDLKTNACCLAEAMPERLKPYLKNVHDEIQEKFYGCGSPIPFVLEGATVLDLGCGTGRDAYMLSQMVGEKGKVIGVDMTENQISVAKKYVNYHTEKFGYSQANVEFHKGFIEDLSSAGINDNSVDLVVSNCVINLSPQKEKVFEEIFRVLKPGGELFFSDVFADRRVPTHLAKDSVLLGECLGGAMYSEDFRRMLRYVGCLDYRVVKDNPLEIHDPDIHNKVGMIQFSSKSIRTFKSDFEDICENFGHVAYYLGTMKDAPHEFVLDDHHVFKTGMPEPVCGNSAKMLSESRYGKHFRVDGDFSTHYGAFDCSGSHPAINGSYDSEFCC